MIRRPSKRLRQTLAGTAEKPRMAVFHSLKYVYVHIIDDDLGHTLAAASSLEKSVREGLKGTCNNIIFLMFIFKDSTLHGTARGRGPAGQADQTGWAGEIELKKYLKLDKSPRVIEGYDISNISGKFAVGSKVSFKDGKPNKKMYTEAQVNLRL